MKTYLTKQQATKKYGLSENELNDLLSSEFLKVASLNGEIILLEDSIRNHLAMRLDRQQFTALDGEPILLREAAQKYGFKIGSLARWVTQGHIRILATEGNYRIFLNEGDVAYARALANVRGIRSGRPLFPRKKE